MELPKQFGSIESVTENYRCLRGVRVKTCGKSARPRRATDAGDKPCGLKCHVHLVSVPILLGWVCVARAQHSVGSPMLSARGVGSADSGGDAWSQINGRGLPGNREAQNPAYRSVVFFFLRI